MPEIIPNHVPSPRTLLAWDGTAYRPIHIDALGNVQIDVLGNANLDNALQSVNTDALQVRGENQLFSFKGVLGRAFRADLSVADGGIHSGAVPPSEIWVVTNIAARDRTRAITEMQFAVKHNGIYIWLHEEIRAIAAADRSQWSGHAYLDVNDVITAWFIGGLVGDDCQLWIDGYTMTVEV